VQNILYAVSSSRRFPIAVVYRAVPKIAKKTNNLARM
jgi:hypothetical protein